MAGEGYRRQIGVGAPAGLPQADAGDFGAGIGTAVERAGAIGHESKIRAYQIQRRADENEQAAEAGVAQQRLLTNIDSYLQNAKDGKVEGIPPSGKGIVDATLKQYDDGIAQIAETLASDADRGRFLEQAANYRRSYARQATITEVVKRGTYFSDQHEQTVTIAANRARNFDDPADLAETMADLGERAHAYGLSDEETTKLVRYGDDRAQRGFLDGQVERNPERALAMLESDRFSTLDPDRLDQYRDEAHAAIRMRDAAARAVAQQEKQQAREQLQTRKAELDTGAGKPSDWGQLAAEYEAIGDTSAAVEARAKGVEMQTGLAYRGSTLPQMDARLAALTAKQQGKGLTTAEASEFKGLQSLRSQADTRLNQPGGALLQWEFATGKTAAPIDLNDPNSLRGRAQQAAAASATYGRQTIEPFKPTELQPLQDMMNGTSADKLRALDTIAAFGDPRVVRGAARQIAGDNGAFRIAATFIGGPAGHAMARDILNGPDALRANAGIWMEKQARALFGQYQAPLLGMGPEYTADTFEAAKAIYASQMKATGATAWSESAYRRSIEAAMGGVRAGQNYKGGTAAINGARVMIPNGWTADGVSRRLARMTGEDLGSARASGPGRWPDGSPVYTGQLRQMVPVFLGGTRYGFRSPQSNRLLPAEGGGPFTLDVAKVPWR